MIEIFSETTKLKISLIKKIVDDYCLIYAKKNVTFIKPRIKLTIFTRDKAKLGFCQEESFNCYRIGISENLLKDSVSEETFKDVIGHETAHMINMHLFKNTGHNKQFREICKDLGVQNNESYLLNDLYSESTSSSIIEKIKKLLALSESANIHESNSALLKARNLMAKHNISVISDSEKIYRCGLIDFTNFTIELNVLSNIVKKVTGCWILRKDQTNRKNRLYIHGSKTEVEVGEYLFHYLKRELAEEYAKVRNNLNYTSGAKKSFYIGVLEEINLRFEKQERTEEWGLIKIAEQKNEQTAKNLIYAQTHIVSKHTILHSSNLYAREHGKEVGKNIRLNQGIKAPKNSKILSLS